MMWVREIRTVKLQRDLLSKNNQTAFRTRRLLDELGVTMINLIGAPGAGKTTLLEAAIARLRADGVPMAVALGDQSTNLDARRIAAAGVRALQINTGAGCHLDASMVADGLGGLAPEAGTIVFVENVGNLVCPALFDLGERAKVVVMSVTQGEDEPLKYSHVFRAADLLVLTKVDLLPHLSFDVERCLTNARRVSPRLACLKVASPDGEGLDAFCAWVRSRRPSAHVP